MNVHQRALALLAISDSGNEIVKEAEKDDLPVAHDGPQKQFVESEADITIYGGAAGGGKTWGLKVVAMDGYDTPGYRAVIFRREQTQIRIPGGLWDETGQMYQEYGGIAREKELDWKFPSGAVIKLSGLEREKDKRKWQGSQMSRICFDELTHFTESQFEYVALSRGRSATGIPTKIFAGTNPVPPEDPLGGWVARLVQWWWDKDTGYAIPERSGVIRFFFRGKDDELEWYGSKEEAMETRPELGVPPISLTFICARLDDNHTLTKNDPGYRARLMALNSIDRERLLAGNWKITGKGGGMLRREWFRLVEDPLIQSGGKHDGVIDISVRAWDLAGTAGGMGSATVGVLMSRYASKDPRKRIVIRNMKYARVGPAEVLRLIIDTIVEDGPAVIQRLPIDPAQAGKFQQNMYQAEIMQELKARGVHLPPNHLVFERVSKTGSKWERAKPFAAIAKPEDGNTYGAVDVVAQPWSSKLIDELHQFDNTGVTRDDIVDACADAYDQLCKSGTVTESFSSIINRGRGWQRRRN